MIKQIYVCECDICGAVEKAKAVNAYKNDTDYQMPNNWTHGKNSEICICPKCSEKLNGSRTYPVIAGDPIPVYGCPAATSDDPHIVYFSDGSQGIIQEITDTSSES